MLRNGRLYTDGDGNEISRPMAPCVITGIQVETATTEDAEFIDGSVESAKDIGYACGSNHRCSWRWRLCQFCQESGILKIKESIWLQPNLKEMNWPFNISYR